MTLINFSREKFIGPVEEGNKHFTIRKQRKYPFKKGDKLQLYTGLRTKHSRKLRDAVCKNVWDLLIKKVDEAYQFYLDGRRLTSERVKEISSEVGFNSVKEWMSYFNRKYTFPFKGQMVEWE